MNELEELLGQYKEAHFLVKHYESVKKEILVKVESALLSSGKVHFECINGSCGWTEPKVKKLDKDAWNEAMLENPFFKDVQLAFEASQIRLEEVQEPYFKLPNPMFFIR